MEIENVLEDILPVDFDTNPDNVIDFTLREQAKLFDAAKKDNPKFALNALNSMAMTAVSVKRINSDATSNAADRDIAVSISKALSKYTDDPFITNTKIERKVIINDLPSINLVPDEISNIASVINFKDII